MTTEANQGSVLIDPSSSATMIISTSPPPAVAEAPPLSISTPDSSIPSAEQMKTPPPASPNFSPVSAPATISTPPSPKAPALDTVLSQPKRTASAPSSPAPVSPAATGQTGDLTTRSIGIFSAPASPVGSRSPDSDEYGDDDEEFEDGDDELDARGLSNFFKTSRKLSKEEEEVKKGVRKRVLKSAFETLGTVGGITLDLTKEALELGVDFLDLAPIPGLAPAAKILLNIWDAVEKVDMNHLACFRLAERCADILLSVRMEVKEAGNTVSEELKEPLRKLESSFNEVLSYLQKNNSIPLIKRYLKRDDIQREIAGLATGLTDALGMFSLSVQIRILKGVQESERQRQKDTQAMLAQMLAHQQLGSPLQSPQQVPQQAEEPIASNRPVDILQWSSAPALPVLPTMSLAFPMPLVEPQTFSPTTPSEITQTLSQLLELQNNEDSIRDKENMKELSRKLQGKGGRA